MDKTNASRRQGCRPTTRRLVQLYAALLHNAHLRGFIDGEIYQGNAKYVCAPGFNCYSCPGAVASCPLGALQNALGSAGHRAGWYVLGILLLFGVVLGRTICGWLCPLGQIQELLHKIPTPKIRKSRVTWALTRLKYVLLAVFVTAVPLWYGLKYDLPMPAFCKYICPAGTLEGAAALLAHPAKADYYAMLGILFTRKWVIMLVIGLACVFCYRSFCRFVCPLGAVYSLFSRFAVTGVKVDESRCTGCGACVRTCGMDVRRVGDPECIHCGRCMDVCARGAISVRAGRIILKAPAAGCAGDGLDAARRRGKRDRVLWGAALAALCLALLWFNVLDPAVRREGTAVSESAQTLQTEASEAAVSDAGQEPAAADGAESPESDAPVGHEVGNRLADFSLVCYDGSEFRLSDTRGKITFINLWATWCTPCKGELPYFNSLCGAHGEDIAVLVVHTSMVAGDKPEDYLADKGFTMAFATDTKDNAVWNAVGGSATLPQTIVLNRRGEVVYNRVDSVTPELLEALYAEAAGTIRPE